MLRLSSLTLILSLTLLSCASIFTGTTDTVSFNSTPSGAQVLINGVQIGVTPLTTSVAKSTSTSVVIRKEGYADYQFVLQTSMEPWFFGNIILGGLIGSLTDVASGAVNQYEPNAYFTTLSPLGAGPVFYETDPEFAVRSVSLTLYWQIGRELATGVVGEGIETLRAVHPQLDLERLRAIYRESDSTLAFSDRVVTDWRRITEG